MLRRGEEEDNNNKYSPSIITFLQLIAVAVEVLGR